MTEPVGRNPFGMTVGELEDLIGRIIDEELQRRRIRSVTEASDKIAA